MPFRNLSMTIEQCNGVPQSVLCFGDVISCCEVWMAEQITAEVMSAPWNVATAAREGIVQTEH